MPTAQLADIQTFTQLVKYLRAELDWPITTDDFEELTYNYTADELGIDAKNAARIEQIKRLKPLDVNQPWGVFFVKFEPKSLPVVALRRILGSVVVKKRASANKSEQAAWNAEDLLFISNYGQGEARQISFAHFSENPEKMDLPTLKVLGWDQLDTALHIEDVVETLKGHLTWPDDPSDKDAWRETWRSAFKLGHREVITTSKVLAIRLAQLARAIRDRIHGVIAVENEKGPVTKLMRAFQEALIHDLDVESFADMYAQTIAYGLLSARVTSPEAKTADGFVSQLPVTNPFLKELMETFLKVGGRRKGAGIDFDELGVNEVVELLDRAKMEAVIRDFGDRNPQEDPVIHFYELFLKEYDAKKRMERGVFYTPRPVVSFIVRSVHELLQTEFGLEDGLADTATWAEMTKRHMDLRIPEGAKATDRFVTILDPATGTGTFLVEIIAVIHRTLTQRWKAEGHSDKKILDLWNDYVPKHLLPRLHGYELLMAPYAIAHMKIGLKLHETGYRFTSAERARVYLTNALEPAHDFSGQLEFTVPALAHEAEAVTAIKSAAIFTVVVGNPPYSGHSANKGNWISQLVRDYYFVDGEPLNERNSKWLQDDYVKFLRLAQHCIDRSSTGAIGFVTNHGYIDNPTFRGMRHNLLTSFSTIHVLDLHGNIKKQRGEFDENVFDIQQGVAIGIMSQAPRHQPSRSSYAEIVGSRQGKYELLVRASSIEGTSLDPATPFHLLVPQEGALRQEFDGAPSLADIFQVTSMGITTGRDRLCISFSSEEAISKLMDFVSDMDEADLATKYGLSNKSGWSISKARDEVANRKVSASRCVPISYRPFDVRILYMDPAIVGRARWDVMRSLHAGFNVGLCTTRQVNGDFSHVLCTRIPSNDCLLSLASGERTYIFPMLMEPNDGSLLDNGAVANIQPSFLSQLSDIVDITSEKEEPFLPEKAFGFIYAVLNSPGYRERYREFFKIDFPRIPLPASPRLFHDLVRLGNELIEMHLLESPKLDVSPSYYEGPTNPTIGRFSWSQNITSLDIPLKKGGKEKAKEGARFEGILENVWSFRMGGFQVCEKWLKDRKGRSLSKEDIKHYEKIVAAISETIRLMAEIEEVIDEHGGWPAAFTTTV